ncbi:ABC transporter G family member 20-like [Macrosteles quadrilineatus]|uniref:ABC transporter G family member 20-like n=1 Tax=Macrosteles quadrilineatus TaxID=74068 RepID=UPI0023E0A385|nr:ABC transporter G family member 20-like [Macrosteles quadrilineatus]
MMLGRGAGGEGVAAIEVRGAFKRYTPTAVILRGLNLTVPEATIYGLLGPSGCGKTTLLRCIVGMTRLDAGHIFVKAARKNNVGYMPQELGLYDYMTIMEVFQFYGKLYGLEKSHVKSRGKELLEFLELPESNRLIGSLSGGQQRRLSFAVTLIHDPQLLILDEPTVGIDPVLSAAIWERLLEMTACQRKTIIITTHYIEEARQANTIGLMRDGVLLSEQSPQLLMSSQGCDTLEGAFLKLSRRQESVKLPELAYPETEKKIKPALVDSCPYWKTNRFVAQLNKNFRWMTNQFSGTLLFLVLPGIIALMCHMILSHNPGRYRTLGIVSQELPDGMDTCSNLTYTGCDSYDRPFTCLFLDYLHNATLHTILYPDFDTAKAAALKNENWGVLSFSRNYTSSSLQRMRTDLFSTPNDIVESSFITAHMDIEQCTWTLVNQILYLREQFYSVCVFDPTDMWVSSFLRKEVLEDVSRMIKGLLQDCDIDPKVMDIPVQFKTPIYGTPNPTFIEFFIPGVVCTFAFYLSIMYTTGAIMFEKTVGLERSMVAGMTKIEVVAAHSIVQLLIAACQQTLVLGVFYYVYEYECRSGVWIIFFLVMMLQVMGLFFGLFLGLGFTSERDATNAGVGAVNFLFMVAGMTWPVEGMHAALRSVIWMFPVQPAVEAYRGLVMRGWPVTHPVIYKGFLSTSVWTAIFIIATIAVTRRNKTSL